MNPQAVQDIFATAQSRIEYESALAQVASVDSETLFNGLFPASVLAQKIGRSAAYCARALYELNPPCEISLRQAVKALLREWDISIEEVPLYLVRQFGTQDVAAMVRELATGDYDEEAQLRLRTIDYWVAAYHV